MNEKIQEAFVDELLKIGYIKKKEIPGLAGKSTISPTHALLLLSGARKKGINRYLEMKKAKK